MSGDLHELVGDLGPLERDAWEALQQEGRVIFQRCRPHGHAWLPARSECPRCLSPEWEWEEASGNAELVSWVVYHRAFHPALADFVPYAVATVELSEGPRMVAALADEGEPKAGAPVHLEAVERGGLKLAIARLTPLEAGQCRER